MRKYEAQFALLWSVGFHLALVALILYVPMVAVPSIAPKDSPLSVRLVSLKKEAFVKIEKVVPPRKEQQKPPQPKKLAKKKNIEPPKQVELAPPRQAVSPPVAAKAQIEADALLLRKQAQAKLDYEALLVSLIAKEKRYPSRAQRLGLEGAVRVVIAVSPDGKLLSSSISKKSKYSFFDREVLRMVDAAAPFPKAPKELSKQAIRLHIPVQFQIR